MQSVELYGALITVVSIWRSCIAQCFLHWHVSIARQIVENKDSYLKYARLRCFRLSVRVRTLTSVK